MKKERLLYLLFILFVILSMGRKVNVRYDYGWQIAEGRWMVENREILVEDVFSWLDEDNKTQTYSHEWLSEILLYLFSSSAAMMCILGMIICVTLFTLCFLLVREYVGQENTLITSLVLGGFAFIFLHCLYPGYPRPLFFGLVFFVAELYIWESLKKKPRSRLLYALPFLAVLWVNCHGGSSALFYLVGIAYLATHLFSFRAWRLKGEGWSGRRLWRYGVVLAVSTAGMLVNPYGPGMLLHPYRNMGDRQMTDYIAEWHTPAVYQWPDTLVFILLAAGFGIMLLQNEKEIDLSDFMLMGMVSVMALGFYRHIILLWAVVFIMILKYMPKLSCRREWVRMGYFYIFLFLNVFTLVYGLKNGIRFEPYIDQKFISEIKNSGTKRLYNNYELGGYFILKGIPVFIDGRYELYSKTNFMDYITIEAMCENAEACLEKYNFDAFAVKKDSAICRYLDKNEQYLLKAEDAREGLAFYVRNEGRPPAVVKRQEDYFDKDKISHFRGR